VEPSHTTIAARRRSESHRLFYEVGVIRLADCVRVKCRRTIPAWQKEDCQFEQAGVEPLTLEALQRLIVALTRTETSDATLITIH
jgi:hypothetical protein